jgi:hypothetical protein
VYWITYAPDGHRLVVTRQKHGWKVFCGASASAQHERLEGALIEAMRKEVDFAGHSTQIDHAAWTREMADQIQSDDRPSRSFSPLFSRRRCSRPVAL